MPKTFWITPIRKQKRAYMKNSDLISIIIPSYNQAEHLEESIQSAVNQTYPNIEIIINNNNKEKIIYA